MSNLFSGINMALRTLLANQQALEVTEHNVANANTPGYHRQEVVLTAGPSYATPGFQNSGVAGQMGTGVFVDRIRRFDREYSEGRFRREVGETNRWETQHDILVEAEAILSETTSDGLITKLDDFWNGWQALSDEPADLALRADLRERASTLLEAINRRSLELHNLRVEQDLRISERVDEINTIAASVASLNVEIAHVYAMQDQPNDLLDERDQLLDRLAELTGAVSSLQENGEVLVSIGGHALVVGKGVFTLETVADPTNDGLKQIQWSDGKSWNASTGELVGLITARDQNVKEALEGLDDLASTLIQRVNELHRTGYGLNNETMLDFFDGTDALSIRLSSDIDDLSSIAAAVNPDSPGDNQLALQIAAVASEKLMAGNTTTLNQFYTGHIASMGLSVLSAERNANDRSIVADALQQQRESVYGVNLDEEAANLIKYQRVYEAAARLMTTLDDMLDRVINGMGRVGL
jgi:flagellar hook-associated protein 1 FlgK